MAQDKQLNRIEAKLDALLDAAGIALTDEMLVGQVPPKPRELSAAEKQAIANAPKHIPPKGSGMAQRTNPATNAPVTPPAPPPSTSAGGDIAGDEAGGEMDPADVPDDEAETTPKGKRAQRAAS